MSKSPLAAMLPFRARKWFNKEFTRLAQLIADTFATRSEITSGGGSLLIGTITTTTVPVANDIMSSLLGGLLMADTAALAASDLLAVAGSVEAAIYEDGSPYTGDPITLAGGEEAHFAVVLTDSTGAGGAVADDGDPKLVAIVAGTDPVTAKAATAPPTSVDIAAALAASTGIHDGVTAWAHYATALWQGTGPTAVLTLNRNNAVLGL